MGLKILRSITLVLMLASYPTFSQQINIGGTFTDGPLRNFHLSIGEYYHVPEREVIVVHERRVPDYELPVVFFLAQQARVSPDRIADLRLSGRSWTDITLHFGLTPDIYYVPVTAPPGPPYGHAYGHWKNHPKREWKSVKLNDQDIIELVNVKFISNHYGYSPDTVVQARSSGREFVRINDDFRSRNGSGKDDRKFDKEREKAEKREEKEWRKEHKHEGKGHGRGNREDDD